MAEYTRFINDEQWKKLEPLLPKRKPSPKGGRPATDNREVLEGILWILRTGARWQDLPDRYPSPSTCWRRLRLWEDMGVWLDIWRKFLSIMDEKGLLDWEEAFIDGSFAPAKKGAPASAKPKREKEQSGWWWSTARVFLWEASLPRHRPPKSNLPKKRSKP
jgi:hypothetical protein